MTYALTFESDAGHSSKTKRKNARNTVTTSLFRIIVGTMEIVINSNDELFIIEWRATCCGVVKT